MQTHRPCTLCQPGEVKQSAGQEDWEEQIGWSFRRRQSKPGDAGGDLLSTRNHVLQLVSPGDWPESQVLEMGLARCLECRVWSYYCRPIFTIVIMCHIVIYKPRTNSPGNVQRSSRIFSTPGCWWKPCTWWSSKSSPHLLPGGPL